MTIEQEPRGPDFIVIGAQRSGTTWLHRVLTQHPQLWLPPVKELHYFDRLLKDDDRWRRALLSGRRILNPWHLQYLFGKESDDWYARLFHGAQRKGLVAGEVTPAYATLDDDSFRRIRSINEDVKLIFTMRDPVERAWSAVNMWRKKDRVEKALDRTRLKTFTARSAYTKTIRRLMAVFPRKQLHFCFFDDLHNRPKDFVAKILSFLGVASDCADDILVRMPVNSSVRGKPVPIEFRRKMAEAYLPMVRDLGELFSGPPVCWRKRYEKLLKEGS